MNQSFFTKTTILAALSTAGAALAQALGGWDMTLQVLLGFMAADYATGTLVAALFKNSPKTKGGALSSQAGFLGIARKCAILLLVLLAALLDQATGSGFIRTTLCFFFIAKHCVSLCKKNHTLITKFVRGRKLLQFIYNFLYTSNLKMDK